MKSQKTIEMVRVALFSGLLCVLAPIAIPVPMSPVPLSFATFVVYLKGVLLCVKQSVLCVLVYLLLGAVGLPVFSGFSGGIGVLLGPTGGYLLGYLPCVALIGWMCDAKRRAIRTVFAMILGTLLCYLLGTVWFLAVMKDSYTIGQAVLVCVVPYLIFDFVKILVAAAVEKPIKRVLRNG